MKSIMIALFLLCMTGCSDQFTDIAPRSTIADGTYAGRYIYLSDLVSDTGVVEMTFRGSAYEIRPIQADIYLIGAGEVTYSELNIEFSDTMIRSADARFGKSCINGDFIFSVIGNQVLLRQYDGRAHRSVRIELTRQ